MYRAVDYLFEDLVSTREAQDQRRQSRVDQAEAEAQEREFEEQAEAEAQEPVFEDQVEVEAQEPVFEDEVASVEAQAPGGEDQAASAGDDSLPRPLPVHTGDWAHRALTMRDAFSGVAIVFLAVVLAAQWVFFNRADLSRDRNWRPYLVEFCRHMQCSLPQQVDLSQIELVNRDVRQHPRVDEALLVNATLSNQADFAQPYPVLEVSFTDPGGNSVAMRRFRPQEYIDDASAVRSGMPPGEPVSIMLEIQDPGESAVSYQFGFL